MQKIVIDKEFHSLIPPLTADEYAQLEANLLRDGLRDALVIWQGENILLDGHNRYEICQKLKLPMRTEAIKLADRNAALDWMDTNQLGRRNLTTDQASIIRGRMYNRTKNAQGGDHKSKSQVDTLIDTASTIASKQGVSRATVIRDGKRAAQLDELAKTNPQAAKDVLAGTKRFNEVRREAKTEQVKKNVKLPDAKFRIIYADPPWSYNDKCDAGSVQSGGCEKHYPSMTISELCAMPIKNMIEQDSVLFLWVTSPLLFECLPIIEAWGFEYKTSFVWDKVKHNMGHYNSVRHEFLLVCTRGSCLPDEKKLFDSVISVERTSHSVKPECFREMIETLYPHGKRLELFARRKTEGWEGFGNEL